MSESSASSGSGWEGRYLNVNCGCGKKAGIKICDNARNKNKLYYYCLEGKCTGFLGWCIPASTFPTSPSTDNLRQRNMSMRMGLINEIRDDILVLQCKNRRLCGLVENYQASLQNIRFVTVLSSIASFMVVGFLILLVLSS